MKREYGKASLGKWNKSNWPAQHRQWLPLGNGKQMIQMPEKHHRDWEENVKTSINTSNMSTCAVDKIEKDEMIFEKLTKWADMC